MTDTLQPSQDYPATAMAVSWAIFQSTNLPEHPDYLTDPIRIAKKVHDIYKLVVMGRLEKD